MKTSQAGLDLITRFEGFLPRSEPLADGGHVIGYGHTLLAKANQKITPEDALSLLKGHDLPPLEKAIAARCLAPLGQNEFDALIAFAFNIGLDNFLDSDVFALVNSGAKLNAAEAMAAWRKARVDGRVIVVDALVRRRAAERALFLEVPGGPTPAATPIVAPMLDLAAAILHPRSAKAAPTDGEDGGDEAAPEGEANDALDAEAKAAPDPEDTTDEAGDETLDLDDTTGPAPEDKSAAAAPERPAVPEARRAPKRKVRVLGGPVRPLVGDSVEDITRAVSKIADPPEASAAPADDGAAGGAGMAQEPGQADDPVAAAAITALTAQMGAGGADLDNIRKEARTALARLERESAQNGADKDAEAPRPATRPPLPKAAMVDDLEPVDLSAAEPPLTAPSQWETSPHAPWASILLYGLSTFGGALAGAWGVMNLRATLGSPTPIDSDWAVYAGPFAMLIGGLIFIIMGYYLLRGLFADG
ncbi:MAG: glycoside hydrolase family protein [Pseudomonadota bacterium]